ncbi:FkbM family methyltransferase [Aquamicrobium sp.]|uniref:FkbM family methyltransferase n=1 Tax=Aquamicrobium sp. TaxID=1872579 RepID=UPI0025876596|nr:FkbM family methyltransferase [Aquamicrobium sp.]MCK9549638.1 FkbM family methyltransferase [Aquamicrobium sp.]
MAGGDWLNGERGAAMRKVFLDVGGHFGQTLEEVLKPLYSFDVVYCFEPFSAHSTVIRETFSDPRLKLMDYGLSNVTGQLEFHSDGLDDMGASVKKREGEAKAMVTRCDFVRASDFFRDHIQADDLVVMKLNCEGSECDIMNDLIDSGEISKIDNVMIDFDVRKYAHLAHEEPKLKKRMTDIGFDNFSLCEKVMKGRTHQKRIAHWLRSISWHDKFRPRASLVEHLKGALRR